MNVLGSFLCDEDLVYGWDCYLSTTVIQNGNSNNNMHRSGDGSYVFNLSGIASWFHAI